MRHGAERTEARPGSNGWWAAVALAVLLAGGVAAPAAACMCTEPPPPSEALEAAYAVFSGRVVRVEKVDRQTDYGRLPRVRATIELAAVWKGVEEGRRVQVWTGLGAGDCGYAFEEGGDVLVYAEALSDGDLNTSICTRTKGLASALEQGELDALGAPQRRPGADG